MKTLDEEPWWQRGFIFGIAGFLFSALTSIILVFLLKVGFGPAAVLEKFGADLSMRAYTLFSSAQDHVPRAGEPRYVLVDIDRRACREMLGQTAPACAPGQPTPPRLILEAARAASDAGAAVILLDFALPEDPVARRDLITYLPKKSEFIVPYASSIGAAGELLIARGNDRLLKPNVHLAAFATTIDATDGMLRSFPPAMMMNSRSQTVPTAPFVAAKLLKRDQEYQCNRCAGAGYWGIFFSLPPMTHTDEKSAAQNRDAVRALATYVDAANAIDLQRMTFSPDSFAASLVVIGTASDTEDVHATPIGGLSGAEILIATIRTNVAFSPLVPLGPRSSWSETGSVAWTKIVSAFQPALILLAILMIREFAISRRPKGMAKSIASIASLIVATLAIVTFEFASGLGSVATEASHGRTVDLITPLVTLGLDLYREVTTPLAKWLDDMAHAIVLWLARLGRAAIRAGLKAHGKGLALATRGMSRVRRYFNLIRVPAARRKAKVTPQEGATKPQTGEETGA